MEMARSENTVRLLDTGKEPKAKKTRGSSVDEARPKTIKLAVRLLEGLNNPLRAMTQYRGDLSEIVMEAIDQVNLSEAPLVDIRASKANETCVMLSEAALRSLKKAAKQRAASLNALVNTAVAHWLANKKAIKLKP
jgi:hypothetical protein